MMPTQIIQVDLDAAPSVIPIRDDVAGVLVLVMVKGHPVDLFRLPRPATGALSSRDVLQACAADLPATAASVDAVLPVSVVVCTRERPADLARCLGSLAAVRTAGHEVLVVDNAPLTSRTAEVAAQFGIRSIIEHRVGLNRARNAGVAAATHEIVAFVDDDVVVSAGWVAAIGACFTDSAVGAVTGLVLPVELETSAQEQFELYCGFRRGLRRRVYSRVGLPSSAAAIVGVGANMAYRRELVRSIGGFDVRLDAGTRTRSGGDTDMFARVLDADRLIVYSPDAYVWHRHRRSTREMRSCVFGYSVGTYSVLTKRLIEQRDLGAVVTAGRWLIGPMFKAVRARLAGRPAPRWDVVLADTVGASMGPLCFGYEAWRNRQHADGLPAAAA
jgi:GT2 family glycosyltransferase